MVVANSGDIAWVTYTYEIGRDLPTLRRFLMGNPASWSDQDWKIGVLKYLDGDFEGAASWAGKMRQSIYRDRPRPWTAFRTALLERDVEAALALYEQSILARESYPLFRAGNGHAVYVPIFSYFYDDPRFEVLRAKYALDEDSLARVKIPALPF